MPRKPDIYPYEIIENIILKCAEDEVIIGEIPWSKVRDYANEKFDKGELPKEISKRLSEDYWRKEWRQGKQILNEINKIRNDTVSKGSDETIINTERVVDNLFTGKEKDKKSLIQKLKFNEIQAKKFKDENIKLKEKIRKLEEEKLNLKMKRDEWKGKADTRQILLFQFMEYSKKEGFPVENIYNTGKTRTAPVDGILASIFSDEPTLGYEFERYITKKNEDKIVELKPKEEKINSALDEYGAF